MNAAEIYGLRYLRLDVPAHLEAFDIVQNEVAYFDHDEATLFYQWVEEQDDDAIRAFVGCNDRFYLLTRILHRKDADHPWIFARCREVELEPFGYLDLWARYHYKMQCYHTLTPTPDGYRKHGEIRPGDYVFGPDGVPTRVLARTQDFYDGACYRVTFDKGQTFDVGAEHLWTVDLHTRPRVKGAPLNAPRPSVRKRVTVTTRELAGLVAKAATRSSQFYPAIPVCQPLQFPTADLPIDPYVFGAWLGDGCSVSGAITQSRDDYQELRQHIEAAGYRTNVGLYDQKAAVIRILSDANGSFVAKLKALGVQGNGSKRIPSCYAQASVAQRTALLQGLLDTDGSCDTRGTVIFVNANKALADDVFQLAAGLGLKPSRRQYETTYEGEPYTYWQIAMQAEQNGIQLFRLTRKAARAASGTRTRRRSGHHLVVKVEPIAPVRCNCIQVDRPDGLYLTGEQCIATHNSTIITFAGSIQGIVRDPEITIGIFCATAAIAKPFLSQIKDECEMNDDLKRIYDDVLYANPRVESPSWSLQRGMTVKRKGNPKEATVEAYGLIDAMPTGRHFKRLVYDDLVNEKLVSNPEMISKVTERWELSDNLGIGDGTEKQHTGTRYDFADTYGIIMSRGILKPRVHAATDNGQLNGTPVFMSAEHWESVKNTQRSTVAAQMLQNPLAGKQNMFLPKWFRPYQIRPSFLNVYIMADPSMGRSAKSDRTAIAVIGIDQAGNKYLLDGYRHRMGLSERWKALRDLYVKWSAERGVGFVKVGYERYGQQADQEYFEEKMRDKNEVARFEIHELNWTRDGGESKTHRVGRLEPDMRLGRFHFPALIREQGVSLPGEQRSAGARDCWWEVDEKESKLALEPFRGLTNIMKKCAEMGERHRICRSIWRLDEDGKPYDVTKALIEEMLFFPFAPKDDLVDAASRIYDMEPVSAAPREDETLEEIDNRRDWADA